jgi:hypothetical protein
MAVRSHNQFNSEREREREKKGTSHKQTVGKKPLPEAKSHPKMEQGGIYSDNDAITVHES